MNNLITLDTSKLDLSHLTLNELNDSRLNLKIGAGYLQLIKGKAITLHDYLLDSKMDVFMATEIWLKDKDKVWLLQSFLNKGKFKCVTSNRSGTKKGGGLALIYKPGSGIKCAMMDNGEKVLFSLQSGN